MTEGWQQCGAGCNGTGWKTVERQALYYTDGAGNKLDVPQVRTANDNVQCESCMGRGEVYGGAR